eukprot:TRINITY_DN2784_c0_g3_i1.p1 TRINITY_DN2784_c0_g3~~TRINITY_DN2784_c0_g3_i1.p1  ORF type:complete len:488 (+),score=85.83 TRINITY_DN2784_c0_g3_i1:62-1525(+)
MDSPDDLTIVKTAAEGANDIILKWQRAVRGGQGKTEWHLAVFEGFGGGSHSIRDACLRYIHVLFDTTEGGELVLASREVQAMLLEGSQHPASEVRSVCSLGMYAAARNNIKCFMSSDELLKVAIQLATDKDITAAAKSVKAVCMAFADKAARQLIRDSPAMYQSLKETFTTSSTTSIRIIECIMETAETLKSDEDASRECYEFIRDIGVLDALTTGVETSTSDILLLLNYLEVLDHIADSPIGIEYCATRPTLGARIIALIDQQFVPQVSGFALKFIGKFSLHSEETANFAISSGWAEKVTSSFKKGASDPSIKAISDLCSTPTGLEHLLNEGSRIFTDLLKISNAEAKASVFHGLGQIFEQQGTDTLQQFFASIEGLLKTLLPDRSHGILEVRVGFQRLFSGLCGHKFAVPFCTSEDRVWDWIMDPDTEPDNMCKEIRFGAVQKLVKNMSVINRNDTEIEHLLTYSKKGPFFTKRKSTAPETMEDS